MTYPRPRMQNCLNLRPRFIQAIGVSAIHARFRYSFLHLGVESRSDILRVASFSTFIFLFFPLFFLCLNFLVAT